MNTAGTMKMLTDKDEETGEYRIPKIIYSDAYSSEMVAYADLILPDTTYLERHDCISLLDRPISEPDAVQDAIRWPVIGAGPGCARLPVGDDRSRLATGAAGLRRTATACRSTRIMPTISSTTSAGRASGRSPASVGEMATSTGRGAPIPTSSTATSRTAAFFSTHIPLEAQFFKHANQAYQDFAVRMGFFDKPQPVTFQLYSRSCRNSALSAEGLREPVAPESHRERIRAAFDPLPDWYRRSARRRSTSRNFPITRSSSVRWRCIIHGDRMNAWLRQIHRRRTRSTCRAVSATSRVSGMATGCG